MNSQDQEISELRRTLPEEHTQQIIILLGRMIHHRLTETGNSTGTTTGKGLEPLVRSRQASSSST